MERSDCIKLSSCRTWLLFRATGSAALTTWKASSPRMSIHSATRWIDLPNSRSHRSSRGEGRFASEKSMWTNTDFEMFPRGKTSRGNGFSRYDSMQEKSTGVENASPLAMQAR